MTVENTACSVSYAGNDVRVDFPTTFRFLEEEHLVVETSDDDGETWTTLVLGDGYEVDGAGDDEPGGTVTTTDPVETGTTLRITRETPRTQLNVFQTTGPLPAATIETSFDKLTMIAQEQDALREAAEAGAVPVDLDPEVVTDTFVAQEPIEDTFPRNVACAGTPAGVVLIDLKNLTTPTEELVTDGLVRGPFVAGQFTVNHLEGLTPGQQYRAKYLVLNA